MQCGLSLCTIYNVTSSVGTLSHYVTILSFSSFRDVKFVACGSLQVARPPGCELQQSDLQGAVSIVNPPTPPPHVTVPCDVIVATTSLFRL